MSKIALTTLLILTVSACAVKTPLPDVRGSLVRPVNPTKWDFEAALRARQAKIGVSTKANVKIKGAI